MFQMTVGKTHPINISILENIVQSQIFRSFQKERPPTLDLHRPVFKDFKKQSYTYKSEEEEEGNSKAASKVDKEIPRRERKNGKLQLKVRYVNM